MSARQTTNMTVLKFNNHHYVDPKKKDLSLYEVRTCIIKLLTWQINI